MQVLHPADAKIRQAHYDYSNEQQSIVEGGPPLKRPRRAATELTNYVTGFPGVDRSANSSESFSLSEGRAMSGKRPYSKMKNLSDDTVQTIITEQSAGNHSPRKKKKQMKQEEMLERARKLHESWGAFSWEMFKESSSNNPCNSLVYIS